MKEIMKQTEEKMNKSVDSLVREFDTVRVGRANPAVLDRIQVDYYGTPTHINQMAAVSVAEAKILVIQPWDKTTLGAIEKAILKSDIGLTPNNDGNVIRIVFPALTAERRKELAKEVHKFGEDAKVAVRAIRRDANEKFKAMKKASTISEDDEKDCEKQVQTLTDKYCKVVDEKVKDKQSEIMEI